MRRPRWLSAAIITSVAAVTAVLVAPVAPAAAATGDITLFGGSTSGLFPTGGIVEGPDGHLYFANPGARAPPTASAR